MDILDKNGKVVGSATHVVIDLNPGDHTPWVDLTKQIPLEESNYEFRRADGSGVRLEGVTFISQSVSQRTISDK